MSSRRAGGLLVALALVSGFAVAAPALGADKACSGEQRAGGDWPSYGHDSSNTRSQPDEHQLGPAAVGGLVPAWSFYTGRGSGAATLNLSEFNSTPVVVGSCVYLGSAFSRAPGETTGDNVFALDSTTGKVVWSRYAEVDPPGVGGAVIGAPLVSGERLLVLVNQDGDGAHKGPYVAAYDRRTGRHLWNSPPIVTTLDYYTNASLALGPDDVLVVGFSAPEGDPRAHGGVVLVDGHNGRLLAPPTYTIPEQDWFESDGKTPRYGGGGVWTTSAVDQQSGYAYYGTGNPFSKKKSHPRTNAILKLDVDRSRATFGQIVASYRGNIDQYVGGAGNTLQTATQDTTCQLAPDNPLNDIPAVDPRQALLQSDISNSPGCAQLDLDFGAAPNLFTDASGRQLVGELQKSGVYHAVATAAMTPDSRSADGTPVAAKTKAAWQSELGRSCQACNASSTSFDARSGQVFAAVGPGTVMAAVQATRGPDRANRTPAWLAPIGDGTHYEAVSSADGVVYTADNFGFLDAYNAADGTVLLRRSLQRDAATQLPNDMGFDTAGFSSAGIAIAQHTVFVAAGSHIVAYRLAS